MFPLDRLKANVRNSIRFSGQVFRYDTRLKFLYNEVRSAFDFHFVYYFTWNTHRKKRWDDGIIQSKKSIDLISMLSRGTASAEVSGYLNEP